MPTKETILSDYERLSQSEQNATYVAITDVRSSEFIELKKALPEIFKNIFGRETALAQTSDYHEIAGALEEKLATLTPREETVIKLRFGLTTQGQRLTLEQVGSYFGITRQRVHQLETKAFRKLRHSSRSRDLKLFLHQ